MSENQVVLIPIEEVPHIYWDKSKARKLKILLLDETRDSIAKKLELAGFKTTRQNVDRLFTAKSRWASSELIRKICEVYSLSLSDLIPAYTLISPVNSAIDS